MFGKPLFGPKHECKDCKMAFDTEDQLINHKKNFCKDSQRLEDFNINSNFNRLGINRYNNNDNLTSKLLSYSSPPSLQSNITKKINELKKNSDIQDQKYDLMKRKHFPNDNDILQNELNNFYKERDAIGITTRTEDQRLVEKILYEIEYKKENEKRRDNERLDILQILAEFEKTLLNTRDLDRKRELQKILQERETLSKLEDDLYKECVNFKEVNDKLEHKRISGIKANDNELKEKYKKLYEIKTLKEEIDYERVRIHENIEKLKSGDVNGLRKHMSNLLAKTHILNPVYANQASMKNLDVENLRDKIVIESERLKTLRKQKETLLQNELHDPEEAALLRNINYGEPVLVDKIYNYVLEIEDDKKLNLQNKIERLRQIRESIARYGVDNGLSRTKVKLKFNDNGKIKAEKFAQIIKDIERLKNDYIVSGGIDMDYLRNLDNLEMFYRKVKQMIPQEERIRNFTEDTRPLAIENRENTILLNQTLAESMEIPNKANYRANSPTWQPSNNENTIHGLSPVTHHNQTLMSETRNMGSALFNEAQQRGEEMNLPDPYRKIFQKKASEGLMLKNELSTIKTETNKINTLLKHGSLTATNLKLRLAGADPGFKNENSIMNDGYDDEDPTDEEKMLMNLAIQEKESLKALQSIPRDSELYAYKIEQIKKLVQMRNDIEKIVFEQRYARLWEKHQAQADFNEENQKKLEIRERLRNGMFRPYERKYDAYEGFMLEIEYMTGLPKKIDQIEIIYGVYLRGEALIAPRRVGPKECITDTVITSKCIINERNVIYDVAPKFDALLIMEFQAHQNLSYNKEARLETFGWSMIDLFDLQRELKRGRWKIPLYAKPTNTSIMIPNIKNLKRIFGVITYLKIMYQHDDQFRHDDARAIEALAADHFVPQIHGPLLFPLKNPEKIGPGVDNSHIFAQLGLDGESSEETESEDDDDSERERQLREEEERRRKEEEEKNKLDAEEERKKNNLLNMGYSSTKSKGLRIKIFNLKRHPLTRKIKVQTAVLDGNELLLDELAKPCQYNTKVFSPYNLPKKQKDLIKTRGIEWNEEFLVLRNLAGLIMMKENKLELIVAFQVLEEKGDDDQDKKPPQEDDDPDEMDEYRIVCLGWFSLQINNPDGTIKYGRKVQTLYVQPLLKPPYDVSKIKSAEIDLEYEIEEFVYDADTIRKLRGTDKDVKKKKKKPPKGPEEIKYDDSPFIVNTKIQYADRPFEKGNGIDIYVDGARFLPDNVTVTKIVVTVMTQNKGKLLPPKAGLPVLKSTTYCPMFNFREELRAPHFDPTSLALISIETIDRSCNQARIVGYSAINLFINSKTKKQPTSETDHDFILLNGNYQLPIYCQEPLNTRPFNMEKMMKLDKLPCSSLLIRIVQAPKAEDGTRVLSANDVAEKDWEKLGVVVPSPDYRLGAYNTTFCDIRDSEKALFVLRKVRTDPTARETATILMSADNLSDFSDEAIERWIDSKIIKTPDTQIIELKYFAKYQLKSGFKFAFDGLHNVPNQTTYVGLFCLNPPGALYNEDGDKSQITLNSTINWESPITSPEYLGGFVTYKDIKFEKNLTVIIDVKSIRFKNPTTPIITDVGWSVIPVFSPDGYVLSGIYQIPIFQGAIPKDIVDSLPLNDPWPYIMEQVNAKKPRIRYLEPMSAIVRLLDGQREGHFQNAYDFDRMIYDYLPPKKKSSYIYNKAVAAKLSKDDRYSVIVPHKGDPEKYNKSVTEVFIKHYNLQFKLD